MNLIKRPPSAFFGAGRELEVSPSYSAPEPANWMLFSRRRLSTYHEVEIFETARYADGVGI